MPMPIPKKLRLIGADISVCRYIGLPYTSDLPFPFDEVLPLSRFLPILVPYVKLSVNPIAYNDRISVFIDIINLI